MLYNDEEVDEGFNVQILGLVWLKYSDVSKAKGCSSSCLI
jgi:hypothetical protein